MIHSTKVDGSPLWPMNVVDIASLTKRHIDDILTRALALQEDLERGRPIAPTLSGKVIALLFFEPSTRTLMSFQSAAVRLGAKCISSPETSMTKGESYEDTLRVVSGYSDLIVMRQAGNNTAELAKYATVPIVNAGDGSNEHPTQALIDLYTLKKLHGSVSGLQIGVGFDPGHSRSIRSLLRALAKFEDNEVILVAPEGYQLPAEEIAELRANGLSVTESTKKSDLLQCKAVYVNRLQRERLAGGGSEIDLGLEYRLTYEDVQQSKISFILNPLPKVDEIDVEVDGLPQARYFEQAAFGIPVRMALLEHLLPGAMGLADMADLLAGMAGEHQRLRVTGTYSEEETHLRARVEQRLFQAEALVRRLC